MASLGGTLPPHSVILEPSLCVGCTTCIRNCPTEAIRVRSGRAWITGDRCIDCGACIRSCPRGAKKAVSDPLSLLRDFNYRIALPAPTLYAQFDARFGPGAIDAGLRALGFDATLDVALGAERVTAATLELLAGPGPRPLVSSACPAIVRLVQLRFPSLLPHLAPLLPPMEVAARAARAQAPGPPGGVGIFFISPCAGKVTMARSPLGYESSAIDGVIGVAEIYLPLLAVLKAQEPAGAGPALPPDSLPARGLAWCRPEGEADALVDPSSPIDHPTLSVDGLDEAISILEALENGGLGDIGYIEALACPSGCLGGPLAVENPAIARARIRRIEREAARNSGAGEPRSAPPGPALPQESLRWTLAVEPRPIMVLDREVGRALEMMERMESLAVSLPGLDCGSCGAPTCRALAEDIVRGLAVETDCVFRLRENAKELAGRLLALEERRPAGSGGS
jgi:iron only hydrogenase large subunit-like protein